ncbi:MAG TPA: hypothetical protein VJB02_03285 [Coxiellaceae bacterium]|nr:hypothetical protein [Coxiellaceae bacterium]
MSTTYKIDLNPDKDNLEEYEVADENVLEVKIRLPNGEAVKQDNYKVMLNLSPDGMIGFGTALIRAGLKLKGKEQNSFFEHIRPILPDLAIRTMGIYMVPKSCELLVASNEFGTVEDMIQKMKADFDKNEINNSDKA